MDTIGASGSVANFNWFAFRLTGSAPPPSGSTAYSGTPAALPGTVQFENYDKGGAGVAYSDTTSTNQGGQYRADGADIKAIDRRRLSARLHHGW